MDQEHVQHLSHSKVITSTYHTLQIGLDPTSPSTMLAMLLLGWSCSPERKRASLLRSTLTLAVWAGSWGREAG